jgi:hypothetical protein
MPSHSHAARPVHDPVEGLRFTPQPAEPARLWVRYAPRGWEGPESPWLDLAAGALGRSGRPAAPRAELSAPPLEPGAPPAPETPALAALTGPAGTPAPPSGGPARAPVAPLPLPGGAEPRFDGLVYLPPVAVRLAAARDAMAWRALGAGAPVLLQLLPGDRTALAGAPGAVLVVDLLPALLAGEVPAPDLLPAGALTAVWPLLPGLTDDPALAEEGCRRLAAAGLRCVQAVVPTLGAGDRRRLAAAAPGLDEAALTALFHRPPPAERPLARAAHRHGLAPFLPRPLPGRPHAGAENHRVAGCLALAAELWLRLGRPVEPAQSLCRAARWLDATAYDVAALHRESNLAVVTAFGPLARRAVDDAIDHGEPALLTELLAEYLAEPAPPAFA